jgi:hypothetical protein
VPTSRGSSCRCNFRCTSTYPLKSTRLSRHLSHVAPTTGAVLRHYFLPKTRGHSGEAYLNLTFRHRASCILGQAFHCSPENAFYIFNQ